MYLDKDFIVYEKEDYENNNLLKNFLNIPDPPKKVWVKGKFPEDHLRTLAVVGTRNMSIYGKNVLEKIFSELSGCGISIISGLALGVDGEAHKQAIKNGLHTIGIPGSGLSDEVLYPKTNKDIAYKILNSNGLLLSEFEPNTKAKIYTFPQRNRIMAALSEAVLIIEASEKSGTLITARLAMEYNKDILAVPGSIFSKGSEGTLSLIKDGAKVITSADDILEVFGIYKSNEKKLENFAQFSDIEKNILDYTKEIHTKDELIQNLKFEISEILVAISTLEWKGYIKEEYGKIYRIK